MIKIAFAAPSTPIGCRKSIRHCLVALVVAASLTSIMPAHAFSLKKIGRGISHAVGSAEKDVGHAVTGAAKDTAKTAVAVGKDVGKGASASVKFVNKEAATPVAKTTMAVTGKALDVTGSVMDRTGNLMTSVPVVQAAAPLAHDAAKAVQSKTAHYAAAVGAGLAVGGGALGPAADGGLGTSGASRVAAAAGQGAMTGYYGRQGYLAVRCAPHNPETKTCTRLESKP
jgi:hypothetical protein